MLTLSPLRIDERVLHYLAGLQHVDERLAGLIEPLHETSELAPSHHALAERIAALWSQSAGGAALPIVQLCGDEVAENALSPSLLAPQWACMWALISAHLFRWARVNSMDLSGSGAARQS